VGKLICYSDVKEAEHEKGKKIQRWIKQVTSGQQDLDKAK